MSTRSDEERAASRAEARRRARLAARGELTEEPEVEPGAAEPAPRRGGFVQRIFPPAPPLPNKPDPLAGFDASGPLRPVRERLFLLRSNLVAWVVTGFVAFIGFFASFFYAQSILGLVGTFVLFGSLIAAGWFGWQRPTLYGTTAAVLAFVLASALLLFAFAQAGVGPQALGTPSEVIGQLVLQGAYLAGLGFIGGWYGGYLRRRQTQVSAEAKRRR